MGKNCLDPLIMRHLCNHLNLSIVCILIYTWMKISRKNIIIVVNFKVHTYSIWFRRKLSWTDQDQIKWMLLLWRMPNEVCIHNDTNSWCRYERATCNELCYQPQEKCFTLSEQRSPIKTSSCQFRLGEASQEFSHKL